MASLVWMMESQGIYISDFVITWLGAVAGKEQKQKRRKGAGKIAEGEEKEQVAGRAVPAHKDSGAAWGASLFLSVQLGGIIVCTLNKLKKLLNLGHKISS